MQERSNIGFHAIEANNLENLDEKINEFLDNALIHRLVGPVDIKKFDYPRVSPLNPNQVEIFSVYLASITYEYDRAMSEKLDEETVDENQTTLSLEDLGKKGE